jgi:subtilisin family serine protease
LEVFMPVPPSDPETTFTRVEPGELVSFTVLCRPASGGGLDEFRERLAASEMGALLPRGRTLTNVAARLRELGFEVFDDRAFAEAVGANAAGARRFPRLAVFARGPAALFQEKFHTKLIRVAAPTPADIEKAPGDELAYSRMRSRIPTSVVVDADAPRPSTEPLGNDAILISLSPPPLLTETVAPAATAAVTLSLPDGVAHATNADSVHGHRLLFRGHATGRGVRVAVVDTGFAPHPYFTGYRIERIRAPDVTSQPDVDSVTIGHGTGVLANLLACAPGVHAWGVKFSDVHIAFKTAMCIPRVRVISLSWVFPITSSSVPDWVLTLEYFVKYAVRCMGITVVVGTGDGNDEATPPRLAEVTAVGGAWVDGSGTPTAWSSSSAFTSTIYGPRRVPDLCGIALLIRVPAVAGGFRTASGVSYATPQVAGVAALLLQKNPALTPSSVRAELRAGATDITTGVAHSPSAPGGTVNAALLDDPATGAGLVNAHASWLRVTDAWWIALWESITSWLW